MEGVFRRGVGLRKGRRVQDHVVVVPALFGRELGQEVEHVRLQGCDAKAVQGGVMLHLLEGQVRHVHRRHGGGPGLGAVEGESPRMGEAVQHPLARGQPGRRPAVVLLVQEEAGLLPVHVVHLVADAVLGDLDEAVALGLQPRQIHVPLALFEAFLQPQGAFVPLVDHVDGYAVLLEFLHQQPEQYTLADLDAQGQNLRHQHAFEPVHGPARQPVRLPENEAAGGEVLAHDGLAIVDSVADAAAEEGLVEGVVGVLGEDADQNLARVVVEPAAQVGALLAEHVRHGPVLAGLPVHRLGPVDPGVAALQA